jgi:hypothetical protein
MIASKLLPKQLEAVFSFLFNGAIVKVIRVIKEAGRSRVPWVYLVNRYGQRRATFVSVRELNLGFLRYLSKIERTAIGVKESFKISKAMQEILKVGDTVVKQGKHELGVIVSKEGSVFVDWGDGLPLPECPGLLEIF